MPYGPYEAGYIQIGREGTAGTAVAATSPWPGEAAGIEDIRTRKRQKMNIGLMNPVYRQYDSYLGGRIVVPRSAANFEHTLYHTMECGISAATPGASTTYTRTYTLPVDNTPNTIKTATIEAGNALISEEQFRMAHAFVEEFELSGSAGEDGDAWMIQPTFRGARKLANAMTGSLTGVLPALNDAIFSATAFYIDATGGTIGTTLLDGILTEASIKVKTGWAVVPAANSGKKYYTAIKYVPTEQMVMYDLTFELEDTLDIVSEERAAWDADTVRLVRLLCQGSSAAKSFTMDTALKWTSISDYTNANGNTVVRFTGESLVSVADSLFWSFVLTNSIQTPV